ncbi:MAG: 6,7-dimethyl-8-ribityllumazine synthase [Pyrinomonadaceae bacterium]
MTGKTISFLSPVTRHLSLLEYLPYLSLATRFSILGRAIILRALGRSKDEESLQPVVHQGHLKADDFRFAIVASRWNDFLTAKLVEGALDALERLGASEQAVEIYKVPGSFEIPLLARKLASSGSSTQSSASAQ